MLDHFHRARRFLWSLARNIYFWFGFLVLALLGAVSYIAVDNFLMPAYTRHEVSVSVPDVMYLTYEEAALKLEEADLNVVKQEGSFKPEVALNAVTEQNPPPNALVKPGRQIYLTVNSGTAPMVQIPSVKGFSRREAVNRIKNLHLEVTRELPDPIPDPHPNTITRQEPAPGTMVQQGTEITLWYSMGLSNRYVTVPDVSGKPIEEAQQILLDDYKLRSVVIGGEGAVDELVVQRQSQEPGTRVREGFEIRLFVDVEEEDPEGEGQDDEVQDDSGN
jgi:beta-lactam-binding protein with PASTA domain